MLFIDCNHPGTIYHGEQAHFDGLAWLGGCPMPIDDAIKFKLMQSPLMPGVDDEPWSFRSAPAFWADNDGKPD